MATPVHNAVAAGPSAQIDGLVQGGRWESPPGQAAQVLTYQFCNDESFTFVWSSSLKDAFRQGLDAWSAVADITFTEIPGTVDIDATSADLGFIQTGNLLSLFLGAAALGVYPDPVAVDVYLNPSFGTNRAETPTPEGDVYIDQLIAPLASLAAGASGRAVIIHELGHALGLKHPSDGGLNSRPTYQGLGIGNLDNKQQTLMTANLLFTDQFSTGFPATPMPLDILAIQYIYGPNLGYHTGDDVWTLANDGALRTIWDAGGNDTLSAAALSAAVTIDLVELQFSRVGATTKVAIAYGAAIENAIGGSGNDSLMGNPVSNRLEGRAGNDTLNGGDDSFDTLVGGTGNDVYHAAASDLVVENPSEGTDTWIGFAAAGSFALQENLENLTLLDSATVEIFGNAAPNRLTKSGLGNDVLRGLGGNDTMEAGTGNDTYYVEQSGDLVIEAANGGADRVIFVAVGDHVLAANVEQLDFYGHGFTATGNGSNNVMTGNPGGNVISGGGGNDSLSGGKGEDTLDGGAGNDTLVGGRGIDLMRGGAGNDTYVVDGRKDSIAEAAGAGTDTALVYASRYELPANVENAEIFATHRVRFTGNALANTIVGGEGNDQIVGGAGADRFVFEQPLGAANVDRLPDFAANADRIALDVGVFGALSAPGPLGAGAFRAGAQVTALDADDRILFDTVSGALYYDADGSNAGEPVLFAILGVRGARPDLDAGDFLVAG